MIKKSIIIISLLLITIFSTAVYSTGAFGTLNFNSNPLGAEVYANNDFIGYTPIINKQLGEGIYDFDIRKDPNYYGAAVKNYSIESNGLYNINTLLKPVTYTSTLIVNSNPSGAEVYVDGHLVGQPLTSDGSVRGGDVLGITPLTFQNLRDTEATSPYDYDRKHLVVVHKEGFRDYRTDITTAPGTTRTINTNLIPDPQIRFDLTSSPEGADVFVRDNTGYLGQTPFVNNFSVPDSGTHSWKLTYKLDGYYEYVTYINAKAGDTVMHHAVLVPIPPPKGSLSATGNPSGADIYLNSKFIGKLGSTPLVRNELTPGDYIIKASKDGYVTKTYSITINN